MSGEYVLPAPWPCLNCGHRTNVYETRTGSRGVRRRRKCAQCGVRFSTLEVRAVYAESGAVALPPGECIECERKDAVLHRIATLAGLPESGEQT